MKIAFAAIAIASVVTATSFAQSRVESLPSLSAASDSLQVELTGYVPSTCELTSSTNAVTLNLEGGYSYQDHFTIGSKCNSAHTIRVSSANGFTLVHEEGQGSYPYELFEDLEPNNRVNQMYSNDGIVRAVKYASVAGANGGEITTRVMIRGTQPDAYYHAGLYTDTLTFTVQADSNLFQ